MGQPKKADYLAGKLLLAMPMMSDPRFQRAVILLCAHDENGAMGLMLNHKLPNVKFSELLGQLKISSNIEVNIAPATVEVLNGGPVEGSRGFLLHSTDFSSVDTVPITAQCSVTGTIDALKDVARGQGPADLLFILGYAGWGAGQLEHEIQENAWLVADPDPAIIFKAGIDEKWAQAVRKMGIDPAMLSGAAGRA